jgi:RHS repeat-associated protein
VVLSATYDGLGRQVTQVDADANTSTTTYDVDGNVKTLNDGKGTYTYTYTYTYGSGSEHRGLVTALDVGVGGLSRFTGAYDAAGNLVSQTYPNGMTASTTFDNTGAAHGLTYTLPTYSGASSVQTLSFASVADAFGQSVHSMSPASGQENTFDNAGRLVSVQDSAGGVCATRVYGFDAQSDRTSLTTYPANPVGTCQSLGALSGGTVKTSTFDTANRIRTTGYAYDGLGRTLSVPTTDLSSGTSPVSVAYTDTDKPTTLTQGSLTKTFTLDPAGRYRKVTDATSGAETRRIINHYSAGGDSPAWIATSTDAATSWTWQRNVLGLDGGLAALQDSTGTVNLQISNLHGDIVTTVPNTAPTAADPSGSMIGAYFESTEYGVTRPTNTTNPRYAWLGTAQRSTDNLADITLMGARLYNPTTGRFLSVDPIVGGGANPYAYPTNPNDQVDLSGRSWLSWAYDMGVSLAIGWGVGIACMGTGFLMYVCQFFAGYALGFVFDAARQFAFEGARSLNWHRSMYAGSISAVGALGPPGAKSIVGKLVRKLIKEGSLYRFIGAIYGALRSVVGRLPSKAVRRVAYSGIAFLYTALVYCITPARRL